MWSQSNVFFEHDAACQSFIALSPEKEKSNDFQPKFAVFCEFLSVLVLQVGVIQDNVVIAESLLCLPFVFLSVCFLVVFCSFLPDVRLRSPRPSKKSNWLCNEEEKLRRKQRRARLMDQEQDSGSGWCEWRLAEVWVVCLGFYDGCNSGAFLWIILQHPDLVHIVTESFFDGLYNIWKCPPRLCAARCTDNTY